MRSSETADPRPDPNSSICSSTCSRRNRARATIRFDAYRRDLDGLSEFLGARRQGFADADSEALRDYLADLDARGFKSSSVARRLSAIRQLFRFLSTRGSAATIRRRSCPGRSAAAACRKCCRSPMSIACWRRPRRWRTHRKPLRRSGFAALRLYCLLEVLYATGLAGVRIGGAAAIGGAARRAHDRGARQGRQGAAGAAERGPRQAMADYLAAMEAQGRRARKTPPPRNGCFPRSARADI